MVTALTVLVGAVVLTVGQPAVATEPLTLAVPERPGASATIDLDALLHLPADTPAPAVLLGHGFGSDRTAVQDSAVRYARRGYVVLTWSARGFGASGGVVGLDDPDREVADVSALVDVLAARPEVQAEGDDPVVGIAGGSYAGGLALLAAAQETRLDAVVAAGAWHSLTDSLNPGGVLQEQWLATLFASLLRGPATPDGATRCGRVDPPLCAAYTESMRQGQLTPEAAEVLDRASVGSRAADITVPTLLLAGLGDTLFPPGESLDTAALIGGQVAVRWVAGGHGEGSRADRDVALDWFDHHLRGRGAAPPPFAWADVVGGVDRTSEVLPVDGTEELELVLDAEGTLTADAPGSAGTGETAEVTVAFPPGGVPAAISSLPGLADLGGGGTGGIGGDLADLVSSVELPGQTAAWTTAAVDVDTTLLGRPELELDVTASRPMTLFVSFADIAPGGRATSFGAGVVPVRVSAGAHTVTVPLQPVARRIVAGNRLRIRVGTTDQGFAAGREPAVARLAGGRLTVPTTTLEPPATLPVAVRILLPVALLVLLAVAASLATRQREARLATVPDGGGAAERYPPILVRGLVKRYPDGNVAVDGLDLTVHRGQVFGLLGPNGAGKTTTMRMLLGLIDPTEGEVRLLGHRLRPGHPVLHRVGVLVEGPGFAPYLTGRQNLQSWWRAGGRAAGEADWDRALAVADLGTALDKPVRTYSHGMRQRLAIAQALLGRPELLVLDEPTDGLDPEQIRRMRQLLARLGEEGLTVLVSSHLLAEVEQMCTHAAVVDAGRVVAVGSVGELQGATRSIVVQVDDRDVARGVLAGLDPSPAVGVEGSGLVVDLDGTDAAAVVAALVAGGVRVSAATPRGRLEDTFLTLTGGTP